MNTQLKTVICMALAITYFAPAAECEPTSWSEITEKPAGFADDIDDTGIINVGDGRGIEIDADVTLFWPEMHTIHNRAYIVNDSNALWLIPPRRSSLGLDFSNGLSIRNDGGNVGISIQNLDHIGESLTLGNYSESDQSIKLQDNDAPDTQYAAITYDSKGNTLKFVNSGDIGITLDNSGKVGIGTTDPHSSTALHVQGSDNDGNNAVLLVKTSGSRQYMLIDGNEVDSMSDIGSTTKTGRDLYLNHNSKEPVHVPTLRIDGGRDLSDTALHVQGSDNDGNNAVLLVKTSGSRQYMLIDGNEIDSMSDIGSTTKTGRDLYLNHNSKEPVHVPTLLIDGGSDLSENFKVGASKKDLLPEAGLVVSIDPNDPGKLAVSTSAYDRRVAGIISGAGGINSGLLMGQKGSTTDGDIPVALSGRVYCKADAANGAIEPGDLLTTSDIPGHAMKVTDYSKAQGAILGKSMSSLIEGKGLVLVLVTLQ